MALRKAQYVLIKQINMLLAKGDILDSRKFKTGKTFPPPRLSLVEPLL